MSDELVRELREKWERSGYAPWKDDAFRLLTHAESLQARIAELEGELRVTTEGSYDVLADEEEDY